MTTGNKTTPANPKTPTQADKARVMGNEASKNGGQVQKGGFAARIQRAADRNNPK